MIFEKAWRWFGNNDPVKLENLRQMGVTSVVTAVHSRSPGEIWTAEDIHGVVSAVENAGMKWKVAESLPVAEGIKLHDHNYDRLLDAYIRSLRGLAEAGVETICYNFMPVLDWARTELQHVLPSGGVVMKYDPVVFAAFDIFILERPDARTSYSPALIEEAERCYLSMTAKEREKLAYDIIVYTQGFINGNVGDSADYKKHFLSLLSAYKHVDRNKLRENLAQFLSDILPTAESVGITMAIHPDDPPFPLLGLPRIVSSIQDFDWIFSTNPSPSNGLTFCSGSLSAVDQDVYAIAKKYAERIHFLHLRNTRKLENGVFFEAGHLDGDVDMTRLIAILAGSKTVASDKLVSVRPDHGVAILDDNRYNTPPGYPLYGRLVGLTEIFSIESAVRAMNKYD